MTASATQRTIDAVWRIESARLIAGLARIVRDVGLAEDLAQDALVAALETWPESGVPDNPGAWLMTTAKHRAIDQLRRGATLERKQQELGARARGRARPTEAPALERSTTTSATTCCGWCSPACHPVLSTDARVALTLRLLGGLTTPEIARAFLVPEARSRSASCAPSARWPRRACRSRCPAATSSRRGWRRCSRSST